MVAESDVSFKSRIISLLDDSCIPQVAWDWFEINKVLRGIHSLAEPCKGKGDEECSHGEQCFEE